jgi:hypothetical protein
MIKFRVGIAISLSALCCASPSRAVVIDFTGGTVTRLDASTVNTTNTFDYDNVDYYEEGGFRLDFLPNSGSTGFATHVGSYYGPETTSFIPTGPPAISAA